MTRLVEIQIQAETLRRACRGEESARAAIYTAVAPAVFGLIRRIVGSRAVAEDLFQDTLITVYERLGDFRGEAPLGAWIRQIAISKCLMHLRSPWHRARLTLERSEDGEPPSRQAIAALLVPEPRVERLDMERALASLSSTARAVVWLYDVEGYSHEEIATAFGRSISFSKSQLARARARLREWFEPQADRQPCTPT
jgi:RNA polymerase sigma factor (sigma-70 family)